MSQPVPTWVVGASGLLALRYHAGAPDASGASSSFAPLLPGLLGLEAAEAAARWCEAREPDPDLTLSDFAAEVERQPWARGVLALPESRQRLRELVGAWGKETLSVLPEGQGD